MTDNTDALNAVADAIHKSDKFDTVGILRPIASHSFPIILATDGHGNVWRVSVEILSAV